MMYKIIKNCDTSKDYIINEKEEIFFNTMYEHFSPDINQRISLTRMSTGSISVYYSSYPIGKIKLQGRKYWMQILKGLHTVKEVEGTVDDFISHISDWERYIRLHCK